MSTQEQLRECFREALSLAPGAAVDQLSYQKSPVWNSIGHMRLVAAIETAFNVMFTTDQILAMSSFEKAKEILEQQGISSDA
ncbi:MAG: acyl carrier protein [Pseudomonadota bacterium]|nr:acyl carrier protein [Pseudomonadota bacterium]